MSSQKEKTCLLLISILDISFHEGNVLSSISHSLSLPEDTKPTNTTTERQAREMMTIPAMIAALIARIEARVNCTWGVDDKSNQANTAQILCTTERIGASQFIFTV
jgi:hypothetical protein